MPASLGYQDVHERRRPPVAPVPPVGPADHGDGVVTEEGGGPGFVTPTDGDGRLGDQPHGHVHRARDGRHGRVEAGQQTGGGVRVAEPCRLGGEVEHRAGGVDPVAHLLVALLEGRQPAEDMLDVTLEPPGAEAGQLEVHVADRQVADGVQRLQGPLEVAVAPVGDASEPLGDGGPAR
jgi:hypothetical protein